MCMTQGMAAAIANPESARLRETLAGGEVLLGRDPQANAFIAGFANWTPGAPGQSGPGQSGAGQPGAAQKGEITDMAEAVVAGARDRIVPLVEAGLAQGEVPEAILDGKLIPAIMRVGEMYERREYFLPQLILSAETMQLAFDRLRPLLAKREVGDALPKIVMATVEGDIHDIGKNIVSLMLRNQGFEVLDLGKDVSARDIVDAARDADADLIGLSALMTTTMVRMRDTVELVRREGLKARVIVGGAVVSEGFARSIGADGYAADAVEAVRMAKRLLDPGPARQTTEGAE
jgi:5-methyltetrahydrofolate--homocysteine methyltransferase